MTVRVVDITFNATLGVGGPTPETFAAVVAANANAIAGCVVQGIRQNGRPFRPIAPFGPSGLSADDRRGPNPGPSSEIYIPLGMRPGEVLP